MQRMTAQNPVQVKIGDAVIENQTSAKLLGMRFEKNMSWQEHIHENSGILTSLNQRLFLIRRLSNQLIKNGENLKAL